MEIYQIEKFIQFQIFFLWSIILFDQMNIFQFYNSIVQTALVIFK
jgi:hypothetical protein